MGRNNYFRFKQFTVLQEHSAMKVGVDSVLLGAWVTAENADTILDIGTGTGLIALMLAQRSNATITAIEIDKNASSEARQNVLNSPWPDRIEVIPTDFRRFADNCTLKFDRIVSNPPYFANSSRPHDQRRKTARHNDDLPFEDLLMGCAKILSSPGTVSVILPADTADNFINLAANQKLFLIRSAWIRHNQNRPYHRRLMEFSASEKEYHESFITIQSDNEFTDEYKKLTGLYYLAF
jgi:tRNA1Val (adenine37-N6)-methyltransferase